MLFCMLVHDDTNSTFPSFAREDGSDAQETLLGTNVDELSGVRLHEETEVFFTAGCCLIDLS